MSSRRERDRRGPATAAELVAELQTDPEWVAARDSKDRELAAQESEFRRAEAPLVEELRSVGFDVSSAWDLVNTADPYPAALPILLKHLERSYPGKVREGIARALAVRDAKFGWDVLMRLYREESDPSAKDGLAVALAATADEGTIEDVIALAGDPWHGPSRLLLMRAIKRSRHPDAYAALTDLEADPELAEEVRALLGRRK